MFWKRIEAEPEKLNIGTSDEIKVIGYEYNKFKVGGTAVACVLTCGLLALLLTWKHSIRLWFTHSQCPLHQATKILCIDIYGQEWEEEVVDPSVQPKKKRNSSILNESSNLHSSPKYFFNKKVKYIWDEEANLFTRLRSRESTSTLREVYAGRNGLSTSEAKNRQKLYGENAIKIDVLSVPQLIWMQLRNPFYVFQLYTIILWSLQHYIAFAVCIALLSVLSIASSVWETKRQSKSLRRTMSSQSEMYIIRGDTKCIVSSLDVVPGDVVIIEAGSVMEVDMVVVEGAVVVTEALLTGESVPTTKIGIAKSDNINELLNLGIHKKHVLYSGSKVLQLRGTSKVLGVVINTGYSTLRGEMVRSILFPKPIAFHLLSDFLKMFFFFLILGFVAMGWSIYTWMHSEPPATVSEIVYNSMDLITFVVPPILPATMTAINVWSQRRLKALNIFCLSSNYISLAGPVDVACFDKTGTLTQDALELVGVVPCNQKGIFEDPMDSLAPLSTKRDLITYALASCHTLTVKESQNDQFTTNLLGHPMDLSIFSSLQWELAESDGGCINPTYDIATPVLLKPIAEPADGFELGQLKVFPFESNEQRMTVVAKVKGGHQLMVFVKGAPEKLLEKCDPRTVPQNFDQILTWYTLQGLRVVAVAGAAYNQTWHQLEDQTRAELEEGIQFLGLVLFHNPLKPSTPHALRILQHADIQTVMITGDNMATAISVARSCNLVKTEEQMLIVRAQLKERDQKHNSARFLKVTFHNTLSSESATVRKSKEEDEVTISEKFVFVMDGYTWQLIREYDRTLLRKLTYQGRVFSRMKPDQKVQVIEELQDLGFQVAMCGDGCNDCGALKAAHVGVSLAATEASVAAPFTSTEDNINCIEKLIREGRATLVSSYASFKYNISYCFASLVIVMIHFTIQTEPSDMQYLIMDLVLITIPSLVIGNTAASDVLLSQRPTRRILHPLHIFSLFSFLAIQTVAFIACWYYTQQQAWFEPYVFVPGLKPPNPSYENTALVIFSFYSFIIGAVVFSHSNPFRKHFISNYILTGYLVVSTICVILINFLSGKGFNNFFNFKSFPHFGFRWVLFSAALANALFCFIWERYFLYGLVETKIIPWFSNRLSCTHYDHQLLGKELEKDENWPPKAENDEGRGSIDSNGAEVTSENLESEDSDEEASTQVLMMRRLSKKRHFTATSTQVPVHHPAEKQKLLFEEVTVSSNGTTEDPTRTGQVDGSNGHGLPLTQGTPIYQTPRPVLQTFGAGNLQAPLAQAEPIYEDYEEHPQSNGKTANESTPLASSSPLQNRRNS